MPPKEKIRTNRREHHIIGVEEQAEVAGRYTPEEIEAVVFSPQELEVRKKKGLVGKMNFALTNGQVEELERNRKQKENN